jgi:hypothetical protein
VRLFLGLAVLLAACGGAASGGPAATLAPEVRNAPERVVVEGRSYTLRSDIYRDLMPGPAPTPRRGVGGTIFLRVDVASDAPHGMRAEKAWLTSGVEVWETVPQPLQTFAADRDNHLSLSVKDGPVWDAGAKVDVVLQFSAAGRAYFIQQRGVQVIGAL